MVDSIFYAIVVIVLSGLNIFQFVFFGRALQTLINKLMSRDFADYQRVLKPKDTSPRIEEPVYEETPPQGFIF